MGMLNCKMVFIRWYDLPCQKPPKQDHQEAQSVFIDYYAGYTMELPDQGRSPKSPSGTPTLMVLIGPVQLGLSMSVTSTQINAQNQQELMATIQKSFDVSIYGGLAIGGETLCGITSSQLPHTPTSRPSPLSCWGRDQWRGRCN